MSILKMAKTICLNMIVKNEGKIITRLLTSVLGIIDTYCICDTGSTDDTVKIITEFFEKNGIRGKIVYKEFVNFGVNRTFALEQGKGLADYLLFLDADMILTKGAKFNKEYLTKDLYNIYQGNNNFQYYNTRIISTLLTAKVVCPTHEYYDIQSGAISENLPSDFLFIDDIGDGGSKGDKYSRDIKLLLEGIKSEPNNCRYYFYLANSYYDSGDTDNAIIYYKQRIDLKGWIEEVFYSWYRLGFCYQRLGIVPDMVSSWLNAYQALPCRSESLYEIIKHYRITSNHYLCNLFYTIAKDIPFPRDCSLFIHKDVYDHKLLEEFTIFGYYVGARNLHNEIFKLMKCKPSNELYGLFNNYKFYQKVLEPVNVIKLNDLEPEFDRNFFGENYRFIASSPSIIPMHYGYIVNLRFVNYRINPNGSYPWYRHITTINKQLVLTYTFEIIDSLEIENEVVDRRYIGVEDIKLFKHHDNIIYTGTSFHKNDQIGIVMGNYHAGNKSTLHSEKAKNSKHSVVELTTQNQQGCEKNWVFIPGDTLRMVYKWYPLTIGEVIDTTLVLNETREMPQIFSMARGSTNGFLFNGEIWFLVHYVHQVDGQPRHYYHSLVVFNENMELKRYSMPFKFTTGEIEYSTGLVIEDSRVIVTHSVWDRESYIRVYRKDYIDSLF
jgi:tetratricopeptide (TPR) repeat protein